MGSGPSTAKRNDVSVVIVGGGYGGATLAYKLVKADCVGKITLIDPREGMFHSIGALRAAVDQKFENKLFVPYDKVFNQGKCNVIKAKATNLDTSNNTVTLDNGDTVSYTHLVIATGTSAPFPGKLGLDNPVLTIDATLQKYAAFRKEVVAAKKIVIVGGGAVGVELSGEIKTDFPHKEVTIVHSRDFLLSKSAKPVLQKKLKKSLQNKKIELMLNERVANLEELTLLQTVNDQTVKTDSGKEIVGDLVVPCTGTKLNNHFFKESLGDAINEFGALCVNEFLQVKGHNNLYALGDVNDVVEEKMAYTAKLQADNVLMSLKGKPTPYKPAEFGMLVPLGRNGGVGEFKGMLMGDMLTRTMKSKDLFAPMMFGDLGVKAPK